MDDAPTQRPASDDIPWSDRAMARLVPVAPATLGAAMVCLSLAHLASIDDLSGGYLSLISGTAGLALAVCAMRWRRHRLGRHALHAVMAGCLLLAAADTLAFAHLTRNLERTADLLLLVVACGVVLLHPWWYRLTLAVVLGGWVAVAVQAGPARAYHLAALGLAVAAGAGARLARLRSLDEVEQLQATASLAVLDPLTGLPDRNGVHLVAGHLLAIARRESGAVGCTFVRVDGFDQVAESAGEEVAQDLLVHVAGVMKAVVRSTDVVARWSTSEFVVVTHGHGAPMDVLERRITAVVDEGCPVEAEVWQRRLLLGHALLQPWDDGGLATTLEAAERDMYQRAGQEPPQASVQGQAEAAAARSRQVQAAQGEAVSELIAGARATADDTQLATAEPVQPGRA